MNSTLNTKSTDARHWASEFCKAAREKGFKPDNDADWVETWFANFWAAIYRAFHDPLVDRVNELEAQVALLEGRSVADLLKYTDSLEQKVLKVERLKAGYAEAIADIESWGAYADDLAAITSSPTGFFFGRLRDLEGCIAKHRKILEGGDERHD